MMTRFILLLILTIVVARVFWRVVDGVVEGLTGRPGPTGRPGSAGVPERGVQMVRDPVCGTFVLPDHALTLLDGRARVFFCSDACRAKYRPSTGSGRPDPSRERAGGRTA
jgi:YHS domain-containing protein